MTPSDEQDTVDPDPIDEAAAQIDPRSPQAPEQIEDLKEKAEALGRDIDD